MTASIAEIADAGIGQRCMTKQELTNVSGFSSPSKQVSWVRQHLAIEPAIKADGRPSLTWGAYERALLARRAGTLPGSDTPTEAPPNWGKPRRR